MRVSFASLASLAALVATAAAAAAFLIPAFEAFFAVVVVSTAPVRLFEFDLGDQLLVADDVLEVLRVVVLHVVVGVIVRRGEL